MRRYETIFIVRPNVAENEIEAITSKATSTIEGDGGTILRINNWGLKKLAYLIKKENQGYYVYVDYAGVPASVMEIERIFRIDDRILKYLTVKLADSCDPEAVKEQLAQAETVQTSDEEDTKDTKHDSAEDTKPDSAEDTKPDSAEDTKPDSAEDTKPDSAEDTKPDSAEDTKPDSAEDVKSDITEEVQAE